MDMRTFAYSGGGEIMYRLIIADDERTVTEKMERLMDWGALGFKLAGIAGNGEEAYELIIKEKPDLAILDINMPKLTGIELVERLREEDNNTRIVFLTGYDQFEYAQKALRLNVKDYILKPITRKELSRIVEKICEELDQVFEMKKLEEQQNRKLQASLPLLRQSDYKILLNQSLSGGERKEILGRLGLPGSIGLGVHFLFEKGPIQIDALHEEVGRLMDEETQFVLMEAKTDLFGLTVYTKETGEDAQRAMRKVQRGLRKLSERYKLFIVQGESFRGWSDLAHSNELTVKALPYKFFYKGYEVLNVQFPEKDKVEAILSQSIQLMSQSIQALETESFIQTVEEVGASLSQACINPQEVVRFWEEVIGMIFKRLEKLLSDEMDVYRRTTISDILKASYQEDIYPIVIEAYKYMRGQILDTSDKNMAYALRVKEFMKSNYYETDLGLNSIADWVGLSPSYLSSVFKKATGQTLTACLTQIRMQKAKELLEETDIKAYKISQRVGFNDPHYFSTSFKRVFGCSPTEYRQRMRP